MVEDDGARRTMGIDYEGKKYADTLAPFGD
jgi:hypothetical protein